MLLSFGPVLIKAFTLYFRFELCHISKLHCIKLKKFVTQNQFDVTLHFGPKVTSLYLNVELL